MSITVFLIPISLAITLLAIPLLMRLAPKIGLMDNPGGRKNHQHDTPLVGGIAIFLGLMPISYYLVVEPNVAAQYWIAGALMLLLLGLMDDLSEVNSSLRLLAHIAVGGFMLPAHKELTTLGDLIYQGPLMLGLLTIPITAFSVAAAINSMNMIDGVDGLLGSLSIIPLTAIAVISYRAGLNFELALSACLLATLLVFLLFNFRFPWVSKARIFMGDAGSTVLGFSLAWLLISLAHDQAIPPVLALYLLALPLMDTAGVICRRYSAGVSAATPGRDHLHHIFLDAGFSEAMTVMMLTAIALLLAVTGLLMHYLGVSEAMLFGVFIFLLVPYLAYSSSPERMVFFVRRHLIKDRF